MRLWLALALVPVAASVQPGPNDYGPLPTSKAMTTTVSRIEPRFSAAASLVSGGRRAEVRCWSTTDWRRIKQEWTSYGFTNSAVAYVNNNEPEPRQRIQVSPNVCTLLGKITYKNAWRTTSRKLDLAFAVVTLSHEAQHIRGTHDEPTAECWGMQRARIVARALGLRVSEADALVAYYWRFMYRGLDPQFTSPECRQGGTLDVNVKPIFP